MTGYEEQILSWLIDSFEKRDPEKGNSRKISIDIAKKLPDYQKTLSEAQSQIEEAILHLQSWGFVQYSKNLQGYYTKISLVESAVPNIYQFLRRVPKVEL